MPIARRCSNRSRMPSLTTSWRWTTPSAWLSRATASGVPPSRAMRSSSTLSCGGTVPPSAAIQRSIASPAPLRRRWPSRSTPRHPRLRREGDELGLVVARARARGSRASPSPARRSSGPRASRRRATRAAPPRPARARSTPGIGTNSDAWRLPSVIVPVLSSSSTSTSPEASTARPESASTLRRTSRSMPAMPIALSSAPIVVGISATSRAISGRERGRRCRRSRRTAAASRRRPGRSASGPRAGS